MIHIVSEKIKEILYQNKNYRLHLWSTYETYHSNIYHNEIEFKIEQNSAEIFDLIKQLYISIKINDDNNNINMLCNKIIDNTPSNSIIILGCTELPCVINTFKKLSNNKNIIFIDCNYELSQKISSMYIELCE